MTAPKFFITEIYLSPELRLNIDHTPTPEEPYFFSTNAYMLKTYWETG